MLCSRDFPRTLKPVILFKEAVDVVVAPVAVAASVEVACKVLEPTRLMHDRDTMEISLQIKGSFLLVVGICAQDKVIPKDSSAVAICLCQLMREIRLCL